MVVIKLKRYLAELEEIERGKPEGERKKVPTLADIGRDAGLSYPALNRLVNNRTNGIKFSTASRIIEAVHGWDFPMETRDLFEYHKVKKQQ